jgi:cobalt-zinc-cadmium efflux system outer membrane protein
MPSATDLRGADERYIGVSQTIPFPGRTWLQGRIAQQESVETLADNQLLREELAYEVKSAFYGVLLSEELLEHARQNLELAQDFVLMTEVKFEAGDLAQVELVRARLEEAKAASELRKKENDVRLARARLNFLLARESSAPLALEGDLRSPGLTLDLVELTGMALEARPEMRRVNASLEREGLVKKQGYMSYLPDFDVGLAKHRQTGEDDTWDMTFSVALPVFFWQPARGEIAEANANYRALREEAAHIANSISLEVQEAYVNLGSAADQIQLFEEGILGQAQDAYEMYQFAFQQGEIGAIDLIEARRTLNQARTSYADALYTYDVARAGLEKSVGRAMEEYENGQLPSQVVPRPTLHDSLPPFGLPGRTRTRARHRGGSGGS